MSEWKPIETAPKDGTEILLLIPNPTNKDRPYLISMRAGTYSWENELGQRCDFEEPVYWMPLPTPTGTRR